MKVQQKSIKELSLAALFTAFICVLSVISFPVLTVPFSLANFAIMLCTFTLKTKYAICSVAAFLGLGFCGLPVFSSFQGGIGVLTGPTGGYIWSYLFLSVLCACAKNQKGVLRILLISSGMFCVYLFGTIQYCLVLNTYFFNALLVCVLPFVAFDVFKAYIAFTLSKKLVQILKNIA